MGIGGGFMLVPMLIYFLRVPTATVIGTSMVLTLVTMAFATVLHAATNHLVDAVLALILMVGGVIGAQFGARAGQKMRGERLRLLLGLLVFAVGLRFAYRTGGAARRSVLDPRMSEAPNDAARSHSHRRLRSAGARRAGPRRRTAGGVAVEPPRDDHARTSSARSWCCSARSSPTPARRCAARPMISSSP